ncbi:MAG: iron ABC transporter permease [Myxococcota bacterium]|nr:iron ABC transporter permease [Myxococcota bacterium]
MTGRLGALLYLCVTVLVVSPWIGPSMPAESADFILWQLRVPRVLVGALTGGILGIVGAAYQTIFGNPLATPSTVGTTAGAVLGALAAVVLFGGGMVGGVPVLALAAFAGALAVTLVVALVASSGRASTSDVLLAGIAITLAASALASGLQFQADMAATFQAVRWSLGHLGQLGFEGAWTLMPFAAVTLVVVLSQTRALDAMVTGDALAATQGVDVIRVRTLVLGVGALGVGATVALCGPIAFVGLIVPHLVRLWLSASRRVLLPMSALLGAALLVLCDGLARVVIPGRELPVGVLTAALGAPLLLWLVTRRRG